MSTRVAPGGRTTGKMEITWPKMSKHHLVFTIIGFLGYSPLLLELMQTIMFLQIVCKIMVSLLGAGQFHGFQPLLFCY